MFRVELDDFPEDFPDPHEDVANNNLQDDGEDIDEEHEFGQVDPNSQNMNNEIEKAPTKSNNSNNTQTNPQKNVTQVETVTVDNLSNNENPSNQQIEAPEGNNEIQSTEEIQISLENKPLPSPQDVFPTKNLDSKQPNLAESVGKMNKKGGVPPESSNETQKKSQMKKKRDDTGLVTFVRQIHENQGDFDKEINDIHDTVPDYLLKVMEENISSLPKTSFSLDKNLVVNADSKQALTYSQFMSHIRAFKNAKEPITRFLLHCQDAEDSIHHVVSSNGNLSASSSVTNIGSYENLLRLEKSQLDKMGSTSSISSSASQDALHRQKVRKVIGLHIPSFINLASLSLGLSVCGFKVALLNPLYSVKRLRRIIQFSHVSSIITTSELLPQLSRVFENKSKKFDVKKVVVFDSQYSLVDSLIRQVEAEKKNPTQKQLDLHANLDIDKVKQVPDEEDNDPDIDVDQNDFIDGDDEESINRKQLMIIQSELEEMKAEHDKFCFPDDVMLVPALAFFRLMCVNVKGREELGNDLEMQKKKCNEIAFIFFSGGKFIGLTHKNLISSIIQQKYQIGKPNVVQKDKIKACLGIHHWSAFSYRFQLLETAVELSTIVTFDLVNFVDKRNTTPKKIVEVIAENGETEKSRKIDFKIELRSFDIGQAFRIFDYWEVNFLYTQPNLVVDITENVDIATMKLGKYLREVVTTSDTLTKQHIIQFKRKFQKNGNKNVAMRQIFGCSEACGCITLQTIDEAQTFPTLAGSLVPGVDMRIIKQDKQGFGEFIFKGPNITKYTFFLYNSEEQNNSRAIDLEGEKYLWTGDKGKVMESQLLITFRVKEVVKHGGWTINELEIEKILKKHPMIADACVMAERTEKGFEITTAYIVKKKFSLLKKKMQELKSIPADKLMNLASDQNPTETFVDEEQDFMEQELDEEAKVDFDVDIEEEKENLLKTQKTKLTEKDILRYLENHNAWNAFDKIHKIHFLKKLPKDNTGKTNKYKLIVKPKELKGSLFTAVYNLMSSNFGVGCLGLAYATVRSGFVMGILEVFFFAAMGTLTCKIAADAGLKIRKYTFQEILLTLLGRWACVLYQFCNSINGFGACMTYLIVLSNSFKPLIGQLLDLVPFLKALGLGVLVQKQLLVLVIGVGIIFPFTLARDVSFLSIPSSFSILGVLYFVIFAVVMAIVSVANGESQFGTLSKTPDNGIGNYYIFNFSVNSLGIPTFLVSPPMIAGAFTSPPYILTIIGNLKNKTKPRVNFALISSFAIVWVIYTAICVSGVVTFGSTAKDDLLTSYSTTNIFASIGRAAFSFVVAFAFILVFFVLRITLKSLFFPKHTDDYPMWIFLILTFIPFIIILFGGMALDSVSLLLSFMGSVNASTTFFILPGLLAWKIYRSWIGKVVSIILVLVGLFMMVGGLTSSFSNLIIFIMSLVKSG